MNGITIAHGIQRTLETLPHNEEDNVKVQPEIRSDNGNGDISRDFYQRLKYDNLVY